MDDERVVDEAIERLTPHRRQLQSPSPSKDAKKSFEELSKLWPKYAVALERAPSGDLSWHPYAEFVGDLGQRAGALRKQVEDAALASLRVPLPGDAKFASARLLELAPVESTFAEASQVVAAARLATATFDRSTSDRFERGFVKEMANWVEACLSCVSILQSNLSDALERIARFVEAGMRALRRLVLKSGWNANDGHTLINSLKHDLTRIVQKAWSACVSRTLERDSWGIRCFWPWTNLASARRALDGAQSSLRRLDSALSGQGAVESHLRDAIDRAEDRASAIRKRAQTAGGGLVIFTTLAIAGRLLVDQIGAPSVEPPLPAPTATSDIVAAAPPARPTLAHRLLSQRDADCDPVTSPTGEVYEVCDFSQAQGPSPQFKTAIRSRYFKGHLGRPLDDARNDGELDYQVFEHGVLRWHRENRDSGRNDEYQMKAIGTDVATARAACDTALQAAMLRAAGGNLGVSTSIGPSDDPRDGSAFLALYQSEGGLPVFGKPISTTVERPDGTRVQYFEFNWIEQPPGQAPKFGESGSAYLQALAGARECPGELAAGQR